MLSDSQLINDIQRHAYELRNHARSQLLNTRESSSTALDIIDELPDQIYERLLNGKSFEFDALEIYYDRNDINPEEQDVSYELPEQDGAAPEDHHQDKWLQTLTNESKLEKRLDHIRNRSDSNKEEKGYNNLFLSIGYLEYERISQPGETKLAPLFLVPVSLEKEKGRGKKNELKSYSEECRSNNALRELLEDERYCSLPDLAEATTTPEEYLEEVLGWIAQNDLPFRVVRRARIDMLPYRNESIIMDLDPSAWEDQDIASHDLIRSVLYGDGNDDQGEEAEDYGDDHPIANKLHTPLPADPSQIACIVDALEGKSLVIDGPPGTGKSQTIANLIALLISQKKSVLFVAEKKVALDVVHDRLSDIGLAPYALSAHSEGATSTSVISHLNKRLSNSTRPFFSEKEYDKKIASLKEEQRKISEYLDAVHQRHPITDISVWDMMWRCSSLIDNGALVCHELPNSSIPTSTEELGLRQSLFQELQDILGTDTDGAVATETLRPWEGIDASGYMPSEREHIRSIASDVLLSIDYTCELSSKQELRGFDRDDLMHLQPSRLVDLLSCNPPSDLGQLNFSLSLSADQAGDIKSTLKKISNAIKGLDLCWIRLSSEYVEQVTSVLSKDSPASILSSTCNSFLSSIEYLSSAWSRIEETRDVISLQGHERWGTLEETAAFLRSRKTIESLETRLKDSFDSSLLTTPQINKCEAAAEAWRTLLASRESLEKKFDFRGIPTEDTVTQLALEARAVAIKPFKLLRPSWHKLKKVVSLFSTDPKCINDTLTSGSLIELSDYLQSLSEWDRKNQEMSSIWRDIRPDSQDSLDTFVESLQLLSKLRDLKLRFSIDLDSVGAKLRGETQTLSTASMVDAVRPLFTWLNEDAVSPFSNDVNTAKWDDVQLFVDKTKDIYQILTRLYKELPDISAVKLSEVLDQATAARTANELTSKLDISGFVKDATLADSVTTASKLCDFVLLVRNSSLPQSWQDAFLIEDPLANWALTRTTLNEIQTRVSECLEKCVDIESYLQGSNDRNNHNADRTLDSYVHLINAVVNNSEMLPIWKQICRVRSRAESYGLCLWIDQVFNGNRKPNEVSSDYECSIYQHFTNSQIQDSAPLHDTSGPSLAAARVRYQALIKELSELSNAKYEYATHIPRRMISAGTSGRLVSDLTDRKLIEHYQTKSPRKRKLRWIFKRAEKAIRQATPCILMSPTSVAEVLPKQLGMFDVVIFDEASQLRPATAYGGLLRAKSAIIVGDPNQLPPTKFFSFGSNEDIDPDEETVADGGESILDIATTNIGNRNRRRLKVHYRSEHESLIAFSNHYFYDGELTIFPSPSPTSSSVDLGVYLQNTNGLFVNKENIVEANAIVDAIFAHAKKYESFETAPSLGVATFNRQQSDLIETVLSARINQDPAAERVFAKYESRTNAKCFFKNLERVQGDERDVIFISYTYGPTEVGGRVAQNFGPINLETGWRRLNVLVTRAKQQVRVFSSMRHGDISADVGRKGRIAMRNYLQYVDEGILPDHGKVDNRREPDSDFEISVANALANFGVEAVYQVGVANYFVDIGVRLPGQDSFILGIECDGAPYHSSPTARMRDAIREEQILRKGWNLYRIWSTDWYQNRQSAIAKLEKAVEEARSIHLAKTSRIQADENA